jgi:galacturan 1,4-alpha-galacturonidase
MRVLNDIPAAGNAANSLSGGKPAAHNTDGFDGKSRLIYGICVLAYTLYIAVSTSDVTIQNSIITNQDDCLAISKGSNIIFQNNHCTGGHGISIGSVASGSTVSNVHITGNTITNNVQALRIKTDANATRYVIKLNVDNQMCSDECSQVGPSAV